MFAQIHEALSTRQQGYIIAALLQSRGDHTAQRASAIDQDPHAPIFQIADVKIVGDLRQVLPSLIERLRRFRQERGMAEDEEVLRTLARVPAATQVS